MSVTRHDVADRLSGYLQDRLTLDALVDWAEVTLIEEDFDTDAARDAAARIGLADHRAFGLTWQDCRELLASLGYAAEIKIVA